MQLQALHTLTHWYSCWYKTLFRLNYVSDGQFFWIFGHNIRSAILNLVKSEVWSRFCIPQPEFLQQTDFHAYRSNSSDSWPPYWIYDFEFWHFDVRFGFSIPGTLGIQNLKKISRSFSFWPLFEGETQFVENWKPYGSLCDLNQKTTMMVTLGSSHSGLLHRYACQKGRLFSRFRQFLGPVKVCEVLYRPDLEPLGLICVVELQIVRWIERFFFFYQGALSRALWLPNSANFRHLRDSDQVEVT